MGKRKIFDTVTRDLDNILCTSLSKVVDRLLEIEKKYHEQGWTSLHIKSEDMGYDGGVEYKLCGMRMETDEELSKRVAIEKQKIEKEEKKIFNKAKKEYNVLLGTGMFFEFFPQYSGEWEKDKEQFIKFYKDRENAKQKI